MKSEQHTLVRKNNFLKEINTFADVVIYTATASVAKLSALDTNALARWVRFTISPVTIRGRTAVQPVGDIVPRFRFWLVKSYPAWPVSANIAITHSRLTPQTCNNIREYKSQSHTRLDLKFVRSTATVISLFTLGRVVIFDPDGISEWWVWSAINIGAAPM